MEINLKEIADLVEGNIIGNPDVRITKLSNIQDSVEGDLTFLYMKSYIGS